MISVVFTIDIPEPFLWISGTLLTVAFLNFLGKHLLPGGD